jgi:hypothetical protein
MMMNNKNKFIAVAGGFLLLLITLPGNGWAQEPGMPWDRLSPEEQKVLKPFADRRC